MEAAASYENPSKLNSVKLERGSIFPIPEFIAVVNDSCPQAFLPAKPLAASTTCTELEPKQTTELICCINSSMQQFGSYIPIDILLEVSRSSPSENMFVELMIFSIDCVPFDASAGLVALRSCFQGFAKYLLIEAVP